MPLIFVFLSCLLLAACQLQNNPAETTSRYALVMQKDNSSDEVTAIGSPSVVKYNNFYYMAYAQGNVQKEGAVAPKTHQGSIGLAVSADGIHWQKKGAILRPAADETAWDSWFLDTPALLVVNDVFYLYYFGDNDNDAPGAAIGLATSVNFTDWVRYAGNPVLKTGLNETWDNHWVESPSVVFDKTQHKFHLYYTGVNHEYKIRTGHATSDDGMTWLKDSANPVLGEPDASYGDRNVWDGSAAAVASAVLADKLYLLYASQSVNDTLNGKINPALGIAYADDFTTFRRYAANPLLTANNTGRYANGPYNPSALLEEGVWKVWYETGSGFAYTEFAHRF